MGRKYASDQIAQLAAHGRVAGLENDLEPARAQTAEHFAGVGPIPPDNHGARARLGERRSHTAAEGARAADHECDPPVESEGQRQLCLSGHRVASVICVLLLRRQRPRGLTFTLRRRDAALREVDLTLARGGTLSTLEARRHD